MWPSWIIAAIALAGTAFMLRFLMALLREGAPSICYGVVPVRQAPKKEVHLKTLRGIYFDDDRRATENHCSAGCVELLERENYAKEEFSSGLIALDVRSFACVDSRSIRQNRGHIFREPRL
jgi:hypothetical protein